MSNIRYAVLIIGALSLLLGLSLGQIYYQHQRIEQLEFNRSGQSGEIFEFHTHQGDHHFKYFWDTRRAEERARREMRSERKHRIQTERVQRKLEEAVRRYNKELELWESTKQRSTKNGLYRSEN